DVVCVGAGATAPGLRRQLSRLAGVERLIEPGTPYPLASRVLHPEQSIVRVGGVLIGGSEPVIIAGPCAVESESQMIEAARAARAAGAHLLRGGAFKPRSSPYSFQGLGVEGLRLLARARAETGLAIVTEVMEPGLVPEVAAVADVLQVGSRNMQNFPLLRAVGRAGKPVLLKRGFAATLEEWLLAAEYILVEGNADVLLCERGVRGFDPATRNLLDLSCVPLLRRLTHLPVLVDPSHATGQRDLVVPMAVAAIAAGADGLLIEMHPQPDRSISDAAQSIGPEALRRLTRQARAVRAALAAEAADVREEGTPGVREAVSGAAGG
ncbi:MAG: 3-deoxy-7-phosphoheptulonate synthase, partial [Ktedonobacterales bacterium]|nr:3-deoxy-7-phosphoheptulonate synthase [Ktedonobacterales bacterium]